MAILGIVTNIGISKSQEAATNEGFYIKPTNFSVSDNPGLLDPSRTTPNAEWYTGPISSRVVVDYNTIKFICTIPPGATGVNRTIREIYIKGTDTFLVDFLFVIGQPSTAILYDPSGSVTLELEISLTNADLSSIIVFNFTQATEINEHNTSPNAHPEIHAALNRAGHFLPAGAGGELFKYRGQAYDEKAEWFGSKAQATHGGVTFTATHTGTDGNSIILSFNGVKTTDQVRLDWNNAHPYNTVEHNGTGLEVLSATSLTLIGGTLSVSAGDVVYRDVDGYYKRALSDGTIKSKVAGFADFDGPSKRIVRATGFIAHDTTGFVIGDDVYLSSTIPGAISTTQSATKLGVVTHTGVVLIGGQGGGGGVSAEFDAVVTNIAGLNRYATTAQAVAAVGSGGRILVDKLEYLTSTVVIPNGKRLDFYFNGPEAGWSKYLGTAEVQKIEFTSVPTSGTWRIEFGVYETTDLAYNATALDVQNAINAIVMTGVPCTVTGNYSIGFTITFTTLVDVPQATFLHTGTNEIQRLTLGDVPDDGTVRLNFNGDDTLNFAWNDNNVILESYLEALPSITDVIVSGSFATQQFDIEFIGQDGKLNQPAITITNNSFTKLLSPVSAAMSTVQQGKTPASNLKTGVNPVVINVSTLVGGTPVGPGVAIQVGADYTRFIGLGKVENFTTGIDLNSKVGIDVEMQFVNTVLPIQSTGLTGGIDFHHEKSFGITQQRVISVGTFGDYTSLWTAITAANTGDKIVVMNDQTITTNQVINKDIEIVFTHAAQINVLNVISGDMITLGTKTKTRFMKVSVAVNGSYGTLIKFAGTRGHHEDLMLELSGVGVIVSKAFEVDSGAAGVFADGVIEVGSATVTDVLVNSSGVGSHNVVIRDADGDIVYDAFERLPPFQEVLAGTVNGINDTFTMTKPATNKEAILLMKDSLPVPKDEWDLLIGNTQVQFHVGKLPQPGQKVYAYYIPSGYITSQPRHLAVSDDAILIEGQTKKIKFGTSLSATSTGPNEVTVNVTGGGGFDPTIIAADPQPDTDANHSLGTQTKAWKDVWLKDKTTNDKYRLEVDNGILQAVLVP